MKRFFISLLLLAAPLTAVTLAAGATRPNVLFILCDDLRPAAPGCYGSKHVKTPSIDALAKSGVRFANDPKHAAKRRELEQQLAALLTAEGLTPARDKMPLDQGIKTELPDQKIR